MALHQLEIHCCTVVDFIVVACTVVDCTLFRCTVVLLWLILL